MKNAEQKMNEKLSKLSPFDFMDLIKKYNDDFSDTGMILFQAMLDYAEDNMNESDFINLCKDLEG